MGNDLAGPIPPPSGPPPSSSSSENNPIQIFAFQPNSAELAESPCGDGPRPRLPRPARLSGSGASKFLFDDGPLRAVPTAKRSAGRISYRKFQDRSKDLREYEGEGCRLTPITFSTVCSIEELELCVTRENSQQPPSEREQHSLTALPARPAASEEQEADPLAAVFAFLAGFLPRERAQATSQEHFIRMRKSDIRQEYIFKERLGAGAFGEVFRCVGVRTGAERAVKVLRRNIFTNPRVKEQFLQEFGVLRRASHPNVLRVFEVFHFGGFMYIVSELCPGGTLADLLRRLPRPAPELAREILAQLFRGVAYLHSLGVLHRDLKPENLAFARALHAGSIPAEVDLRIIDFGLAVEGAGPVFKDWAKIGTVGYMAPEVFEGVYSVKCDSWSCGVVMYEMIAGVNPFRGGDFLEARQKVHRFVPDPFCAHWQELALDDKHVLLQLLEPNYITRLKVTDALQHSFFWVEGTVGAVERRAVALRLAGYSRGGNLLSALETLLVFTQLPQEQRREHSRAFHLVNSARSGLISPAELSAFLLGQLPELAPEEARHIFAKINKDGSGAISFGQFLNVFVDRRQFFTRVLLEEAFGYIDLNRNGYLTRDELKYFLRTVPKEEIDELFRGIPPSDGGKVDVEAFVSYIQQQLD